MSSFSLCCHLARFFLGADVSLFSIGPTFETRDGGDDTYFDDSETARGKPKKIDAEY